jgi:hypothetical protein
VSDAEPRPAPADEAVGAEPSAPGVGSLPVEEQVEEPVDGPDADPESTAFVQVTRRRAPRYRSFVLTGIGLAALVSLVVAVVSSPADGYSQRQLFGFLLVSLGVVGAIVGGLVAVLVERRR